MSRVYEEFERQLNALSLKYRGQPEKELMHLFLLALEREEIVSTGYREDLMVQRLAEMPISAEIREIIRYALAWIWRDEEMHAIYIRGAALRLKNAPLRFRVFLHQFMGIIGGWSASLRQHKKWSQAPITRAIASVFTGAGFVLQRVPSEVRDHLTYGPFRDFCLFNVEAERTAHLCWTRLVALASAQRDLAPELVDDFRRVQADEDRHRRVFEILAQALTDKDTLAPDATETALAKEIGEVSEFFLPRSYRPSTNQSPLGRGGPVWVTEGKYRAQKIPFFRRLLAECGLEGAIRERARAIKRSVADMSILIKPTFMMGYDRRDPSPLTDPDLVNELAAWLHEIGARNIAVAEARNLYDRYFLNRTVHDVAGYFNLVSPRYEIIDLSQSQVPHAYFRGIGQYTVAQRWKAADFRITFGKMRSHPIDQVFLTTANCEGIGTRCDEFLFVERQAQRNTATMMLVDAFPPHFAILDGYASAADGLVGVMGCPRPTNPGRIYAGADALSVDIVAARHMGLDEPAKSDLLRMACHWFGNPTRKIRVIGQDRPIAKWNDPHRNEWSSLLSLLAYPVYEYASQRGSLFVPEMDERAFPPKTALSTGKRFARSLIQRVLGLRLPR